MTRKINYVTLRLEVEGGLSHMQVNVTYWSQQNMELDNQGVAMRKFRNSECVYVCVRVNIITQECIDIGSYLIQI